MEKWDLYYLGLAEYISTASKDPSTKVGAVIIDKNRRIVSTGWNGFSKGIEDSPGRLNDRDFKLSCILHAEENAILFAQRDLAGCTLYTWPIAPCAKCSGMIIQSGISRVVFPSLSIDQKRWEDSIYKSKLLFCETGIEFKEYIIKKENQ